VLDRKLEWTNLKKLYEFESSRVSGPGSYRRDINDVLWTMDQLRSSLSLQTKDLKDFERMVSHMIERREMMKVPMPDGKDKHITRVAETVRLLGHNYEYWFRGRQGIDSVRWLIEDKKVPFRRIAAEPFIEELLRVVASEIGNSNSTFNLRKAIEIVIKGVANYFEPSNWKNALFSDFQLQATKEMILTQFKPNHKPRVQILTAGVGSGKTVAFSIAMLVSAVEGILSGERQRKCHLFLYPRKALAHDQYKTLSKIVEKIELQQLSVHFEHHSFYESQNLTVKDGIATVYGQQGAPSSIIVTTLETLNRRLHHPLVIGKLAVYLKRVVLDEIHLVEGIPGCHIIRLMDRLRQACHPREILWTGSSATVANPDLHAATVFGVAREDVRIIEPNIDDLSNVGLIHHVFMRPTGTLSFLGTLVNSTSILVHNRRDKIWERTGSKYPKTIGFADNLDLLGRWNSDLRENERTESALQRPHPESPNPEDWKTQQREIPYALRFHNPLERRINTDKGKGEEGYEPVLQEFKDQEICNKCRAGQRIRLKVVDKDELQKLGRLVYREPSVDKDKVKTFHINNKEIFGAESAEIGTLDLCPYLRAGACFWFAQDDFETQQLTDDHSSHYEWRSLARSKVHSSKTSPKAELEDDLSELVFTATTMEAYDLPTGRDIPIDIVLASPSLEVGVDLPNVTESIMFKAIRNVASYRQKAGRIGREEESNAMNTTLVSLRPIDLHYYRQPRKIISQAQLEPIPLKEYNDSILRCALYVAVWDYLALHSDLPEVIPLGNINGEESSFTERLKRSRNFLDGKRKELALYLSMVSRGKYNPRDAVIAEVVDQVADELEIFLTPTHGTIDDERISYISDMIVRFLNPHTAKVTAPKHSWNLDLVRLGGDQYKNLRPHISPVLLGLSEEFQELDRLEASGWIRLSRIKEVDKTIEAMIERLGKELHSRTEATADSQKLAILRNALGSIVKGLEGMKAVGENPTVVYFYQQYDKFRKEHPSWPYYLSYTLQGMPVFNLFKKNPSYTMPANLFINPYAPTVALYRKGEVEDCVPVDEALFSFLPGTWTFRLGKTANKTLAGKLDSHEGGVLYAKLLEMREQGSDFVRIKQDVPAPPGFPTDSLTLYMPTRLVLKYTPKYVNLNVRRHTIIDNDEDTSRTVPGLIEEAEQIEGEEGGEFAGGRRRVKIPESHPERWVHVIADEGKRITVNKTNEESLVIEGGNEVRGFEARSRILHPMLNGIIEAALWHDKLEVYDYVCSVSRSYTSKAVTNATLMFRDEQGDVGFGHYFCTEGVSFELCSKSTEDAVQRIKNEMLNFENKWAPSLVKAFRASLSSMKLADGTGISPLIIDDLLGVLITSSSGLDSKAIIELPEIMKNLLEDEAKFKEAARIFYEGKYLVGSYEEESGPELSEQDRRDIDVQVNRLVAFAFAIKDCISDISPKLEDWIMHTLLNTFGLCCLSALQQLCGSKEEDVGYTVDLEGMKNRKYRVFLYDRTEHGNGSSDVLRRYLYILNIQRHRQTDESRLLPSEDFFTLLEQELLQCPQFHVDMDALEKFNQKQENRNPKGMPELGYVSEYSDEVLRVCEHAWKQLGIAGRNDAWKLPIMALAPASFARSNGLEIDDVIRATTICWSGCPECVINTSAMIGFLGTTFTDKVVLDEWFRIARGLVAEYKTLSVEDLAAGKARVEIGRQTRACLELPNRKIRSISLPFTIGFEIDRSEISPHARLIVRDGDIENLQVFGERFDGCAHGLESLGFKRIMWYNLMTASYLDILDLLEDARKDIFMVFYDCRDVGFDDVGISSRMMEALDYHRRKAGLVGEIRSLSDILNWLAIRGFRISLCVDETRAQEESVKSFLEKLASWKMRNVTIRLKGLQGSMHKKALITPIGAIHGSANLTFSGTQLSEEIISYAPCGTREYNEMKLNILDTFHGSKEMQSNRN
jgi:hypothetical protein